MKMGLKNLERMRRSWIAGIGPNRTTADPLPYSSKVLALSVVCESTRGSLRRWLEGPRWLIDGTGRLARADSRDFGNPPRWRRFLAYAVLQAWERKSVLIAACLDRLFEKGWQVSRIPHTGKLAGRDAVSKRICERPATCRGG